MCERPVGPTYDLTTPLTLTTPAPRIHGRPNLTSIRTMLSVGFDIQIFFTVDFWGPYLYHL